MPSGLTIQLAEVIARKQDLIEELNNYIGELGRQVVDLSQQVRLLKSPLVTQNGLPAYQILKYETEILDLKKTINDLKLEVEESKVTFNQKLPRTYEEAVSSNFMSQNILLKEKNVDVKMKEKISRVVSPWEEADDASTSNIKKE